MHSEFKNEDEDIDNFVNPELDDDFHNQAFIKIKERILSSDDRVITSNSISMTIDNDINNLTSSSSSLTLQDLIGCMELQLTAEDDKYRYRSTLLLAELLYDIPSCDVILPPPVMHLFIIFFCRRLSDYPSILPSLHALLALIKYHYKSLDNKYCDIVEIYQSIFRELQNVQGLVQTIRHKVFELLHALLLLSQSSSQSNSKVSTAISSTTQQLYEVDAVEVLEGLIHSMDGERDPRCLVSSLKLLSAALNCFSNDVTEDISENFFNASACYFPITFSPPSDDPFGITKDMLVNSLQSALCSHKLLLPHVLPHFVEHLTSEYDVGKIQALSSIVMLCKIYGIEILRQYSSDTNQMIVEIICLKMYDLATDLSAATDTSHQSDQQGVKDKALSAITDLCFEISKEINGKYLLEWRKFAEPMLQRSTMELIGNAEGIQAHTAAEISYAVARGSCLCCKAVMDRLVPILLPKIEQTIISIRQALVRSISSSLKGIKYLPPLQATSTIVPASFQLMSQLIRCNGSDGQVNYTHMKELNPMSLNAEDTFKQLCSLFDDFENNSYISTTVSITNAVPIAVNIGQDISASIAEAIICMKEILCRSLPCHLPLPLVIKCIETISDITIYGVEILWKDTKLSVTGSDLMIIRDVASSLLSSLAMSRCYDDILNKYCVSRLETALKLNVTTDKIIQLYSIMSILSRQGPATSLMSLCLPHLLSAVMEENVSVKNYNKNENNIKQYSALKSIADLLPTEHSIDGNSKIVITTDISSRSKYLAGIKAKNIANSISSSPLVTLIIWMLRQDKIEDNVNNELNVLIRKVVLSLDTTNQSLLIAEIINAVPNEIFDSSRMVYSSSTNNVLKIMSSLLAYVDHNSNIFVDDSKEPKRVLDLNISVIQKCINISFFVLDIENNESEKMIIGIEYASFILALIVNKLPIGKQLDSLVLEVQSRFDNDTRKNMMLPFLWTSKALMMRSPIKSIIASNPSHRFWQDVIIAKILSILYTENSHQKDILSTNFSLLTKEHEYILSSKGKCISTSVWKQRLWSKLFPSLLKGLQNSTPNSSQKRSYLLSICGLSCGMHNMVLTSSISDLVTVSVQAITAATTPLNDTLNAIQQKKDSLVLQSLKIQSLEILEILLKFSVLEFSTHISSIVPLLVKISDTDSIAKVRALSLKCLLEIINGEIPYSKLHPFKNLVVKGLSNVIDDRKRLVRYLAAKVRNEWIVIK